MLNYLHVKNLALIKDVELDLSDGLTVFSGETGAGKSLLLGSILLALGSRADSSMIRNGEENALIELVFHTDNEETISAISKLGITVEHGDVILNRRIYDGKSIAKINGETVPLNLLRQVSQRFFEVSGQHEVTTLLSEENHLRVLDEFGKEAIGPKLSAYQESYANYKKQKEEAGALTSDEEQRHSRMDYLSFMISEIQNAELKEGELDGLSAELKTLTQSEKIRESLSECREALDSTCASGMKEALSCIKNCQTISKDYEHLTMMLKDADALITDCSVSINKSLDKIQDASERIPQIEERLSVLKNIAHKYGDTYEKVMENFKNAEEEMNHLSYLENCKDEILQKLENAKQELISSNKALHEARMHAKESFERELTNALSDLNFLQVVFEVHVEETNRFSRTGADVVKFYLSTNPGEEPKPISEIASGGELSRILLSLKTILQELDSEKTMLFDEIDAGISGKTAVAVATKIRKISQNHQVLLISHLPQIVSACDHHFKIEKTASENETTTNVKLLSDRESIDEIARLLGTGEVTQNNVLNAMELRQSIKMGLEPTE